METPARDLRGRLSVGGAKAKTSVLAVLRGPIRRRPYNRGKIIAMKRGKLIVIYRLLVTGRSGMDGSNRVSPRGTGVDTGMGRQWLAQPLWANIANLDPTLSNGGLLTLLEGAAQALLVEGDVAAVGLTCAEQRLEKTHERFTVRWNVGAILPAYGDRLMTWAMRRGCVTIAPAWVALALYVRAFHRWSLAHVPRYTRGLSTATLPERCTCCTACCSL